MVPFRREGEWPPDVLDAGDAILELRSMGLPLPVTPIYDGESVRGSYFEHRVSAAPDPAEQNPE
jgi:hypothetical protein